MDDKARKAEELLQERLRTRTNGETHGETPGAVADVEAEAPATQAKVEELTNDLKRMTADFSNYRKRLVRNGSAPFKCRAGSRYLYVDEFGKVNWCSQTRSVWSKALADYTLDDLREQFFKYKSCNATCTLGCARSASQLDNWRSQPVTTLADIPVKAISKPSYV